MVVYLVSEYKNLKENRTVCFVQTLNDKMELSSFKTTQKLITNYLLLTFYTILTM
jgi:hypothetical protein